MPQVPFRQRLYQLKHLGLGSIDQPPFHIRFHIRPAAAGREEVRQQELAPRIEHGKQTLSQLLGN